MHRLLVDNFELITETLMAKPVPEGEFYFVQILTRKKDDNEGGHANGNNRQRLIRYYCVDSKEKLLRLKPEITELCHLNNARAYIHPTRRSYKEIAALGLQLAAEMYVKEDYVGFRSLFSTACGRSFISGDKKFVVDIDSEDISVAEIYKDNVKAEIFKCRGAGGENSEKVVATIPTKHGFHLITHPFDVGQFQKLFKDVDVHKNNPTLLYYKDKDAIPDPKGKSCVRNCDVGAVEEWEERYLEFCNRHDCSECPFGGNFEKCEFLWADAPYEKEEG